jgi:hypothetical protein
MTEIGTARAIGPLLLLALPILAGCTLPPAKFAENTHAYQPPSTGTFIAGNHGGAIALGVTADPDAVDRTYGVGSPGYIKPGSSR